MWEARTKGDLIVEVWEKLDCENVGKSEIVAIETVVREVFGESAVETPMIIARQLADEGAELRHAEILALDVNRRSDSPYAAMFRNLLDTSNLDRALVSIRKMDNLRKKFSEDSDKDGLRRIRETAIREKEKALERSKSRRSDAAKRLEYAEIAEWLTLWLQSPEMFESWVKLRRKSADYKKKFGAESDLPD